VASLMKSGGPLGSLATGRPFYEQPDGQFAAELRA